MSITGGVTLAETSSTGSNSSHDNGKNVATCAVRAGIETDAQHGAVTPPLYLSSNYAFEAFAQPREFDYARSGNPTRATLEQALAELEGGAGASVTCSGMAAVTLALQLVPKGGLVIAPHDCYGGTYRLLKAYADRGQITVKFVDQARPELLAPLLKLEPELLWIETPSNPLLRVVDIKRLTELATKVGCLSLVDNTFLSPVLQRPLELGADLVLHSTTKYINGHSDVVGGAVIAKEQELAERIGWWANCIGVTGSPFDSLLTLRGLRTLDVRIKRHVENAERLVEYLGQQSWVGAVYYPGLTEHPGHLIAARQQTGFGAMLSFELDTEQLGLAEFLESLQIFTLAESLGGVESLVCHPATMTHAAMDLAARTKAGISHQLIRISVGIEHIDDLIADFEQAVKSSVKKTSSQTDIDRTGKAQVVSHG